MHVILDASSAMPPRTGIGNHTLQLARHLLRADRAVSLTLFLNSLRRSLPDGLRENLRPGDRLRRRRIPGPWLHNAWKRFDRPAMETLAGQSADLVHAPASVIPPVRKASVIATLHDCYFMRHPENCHRLGGAYMRATLPGKLQRCAAVICVSHFTRNEALEFFPLDPVRLHVVHSGVDCGFFRPLEKEEARRIVQTRLNPPSRFLLTVATLEPRKNLVGLLRALAQLKKILPNAPKLVCAGAEGFQTEPIRRAVTDLRLRDDVVFTGFVPDEILTALYNLAEAVVAPSFYEGFGLAALEAMVCGRPVVASEAFREACGDAAHYGPSENPEFFAEKIRELLLSPALQAECRSKGLERVREFTWEETARKTLKVYEAAGSGQ